VTKLPGTWKVRHFVDVIVVKCRPTAVTVETVNEIILPKGPANKSRQSR
jgi:hypothetical protein